MRRVLSTIFISTLLLLGLNLEAKASTAPITGSSYKPVYKANADTNKDKNDTVISQSSRKISAIYPTNSIMAIAAQYPGYRGPGQLVVYKENFGKTTGTNEFGKEAVVVDDIVVRLTGANSLIPKGGYVISGHGAAKKWISDNLKVGTKIKIDEETKTITVYTTLESYRYLAKSKIKEVEDFISNSKRVQDNPAEKKAKYYLKKAKQDLRKSQKAEDRIAIGYAKSSVEMSKIALNYALPYISDELKGVWIRPTERNTYEVQKTLDNMQSIGITNIFLETYFHGLTIYPSAVMRSYGFTIQNPKFIAFDPLKAYIVEAHKRGMKVHCWFESFYVGNKNPENDPTSILKIKPEWSNKTQATADREGYVTHPVEHNGYFIDPANPEVQNFLTLLVKEITSNYGADGINLDYIRYPSTQKPGGAAYVASNWGYTAFARSEFKRLHGVDPVNISYKDENWNLWAEYRQNKVTSYVAKIRNVVPKEILLSAVIFPDYKTCLATKQQDWITWSKKGYVDAFTPLILTSDDELFNIMLKEIKDKISSQTRIYPGLFIGFMEGETEDLLKQINVSRGLKTQGVVLFDWAHLDNKYKNTLKFCIFTEECK